MRFGLIFTWRLSLCIFQISLVSINVTAGTWTLQRFLEPDPERDAE